MLLFEQVLSIGLIGIIILFAGLAIAQSIKAHRKSNLTFEAQNLAEDTVESYQALGLSSLPAGPVALEGTFSDQTPYRTEVTFYSLPDSGPSTGLTDEDIRGVRVSVTWSDRSGQHVVKSESLVVRIQR
jgi:hypothetical protein